MDNTGESNAGGGETGRFIDISAQRGHDLLRIHNFTSTIGDEFHQEDDGKHPKEVDNDLEALKLEYQLVEDYSDDAGALGDEEPWDEKSRMARSRGQREDFSFPAMVRDLEVLLLSTHGQNLIDPKGY